MPSFRRNATEFPSEASNSVKTWKQAFMANVIAMELVYYIFRLMCGDFVPFDAVSTRLSKFPQFHFKWAAVRMGVFPIPIPNESGLLRIRKCYLRSVIQDLKLRMLM